MKKLLWAASSAVLLVSSQALANDKIPGYLVIEGGVFWASQGEDQNINIESLIGDHYSVTSGMGFSGVFGLGYLLEGIKKETYGIDYGVNAFYFLPTTVSGDITQELMFENFSYSYDVSHTPVYVMTKAHVNTGSKKVSVTFDAGVGVNFMKTSSYDAKPLNDYSENDHAFSGQGQELFSAMLGMGVRFNVENAPFEIGYRGFYLGNGVLDRRNNQILNTLETGNIFAHTLLITGKFNLFLS